MLIGIYCYLEQKKEEPDDNPVLPTHCPCLMAGHIKKHTIMIRKNALFCKLFFIKKSSKRLFDEYMLSYSWENETCPWCSSTGNCTFHGLYTRSLIDFVGGKTVYEDVSVLRLACSSCGHTHAILPDAIIPYATYSILFILRVLAEYFLRRHTVEELCARFGISVSMLYRWKKLFLLHKRLWLGVLDSMETSPFSFLRGLCLLADYSQEFSCRFVLLSARSFLQSHKNFAAYRQTVF